MNNFDPVVHGDVLKNKALIDAVQTLLGTVDGKVNDVDALVQAIQTAVDNNGTSLGALATNLTTVKNQTDTVETTLGQHTAKLNSIESAVSAVGGGGSVQSALIEGIVAHTPDPENHIDIQISPVNAAKSFAVLSGHEDAWRLTAWVANNTTLRIGYFGSNASVTYKLRYQVVQLP